ncbi:uncharacterized protein LOC118277072 [Spodoptera frugiperda]|uniref:Uncharacterized protein LOC118277072 n=1 Tax=Spodoptera frugiperda TaxID=7108 RepID=A0A9R0EQ81_SPOFR|nr:uncharacterized protein LOC118277072 [Spodoptera frugiperda]
MDIGKLLKNVHSLTEYISTTQDASEKCKTSKIQLNMSTVLALKKIRSLEIEYFNKCEENGIACVIFERMLCLPPSKTWGVLSKELVNLLQYWLDAIRKHLVRHNSQWWTFMKLLLTFIKEIRQKDTSLPNILVEHTAECLLDLATNTRPDALQKHEILHCFNMYCSESSREIRFAMRNKFGQYFTKLSNYMSSCGHLPTQYSIMETLLRWLLPRQDRTLRLTSAAKWFPSSMYAESDVDIFLERPWVNFFQDARDFLNAHNQRHDDITSVVCRKFTVGKVVIISGTERQESWLDINMVSKCVSVLLDPRVLDTFGSTNHKSFETLVVTQQNTESAKLHKESPHLLLSIRTTTPPQVLPSNVHLGDDVGCDVTAVLTTRCDVTRLNDALRKLFEDKYELLLDLEKDLELSPMKATDNSKQTKNTDEDQRFSHPVEVRRRKHSGYIVKPRQPLSCMSPSTASTSSLAQLHEKLAALPRYKYDKEPVSVCAPPDLSIVTEVSEADDRQSLNTTFKSKPYGVCYKNLNTLDQRKSQSDPESSRKHRGRRLSPIVNEDTTSCLLVATVGSADDSVINDTVERLSKSKDYNPDNIVDLLVQEALQAKQDDKYRSDSGINTGDKKSQDIYENTDTIDGTPEIDQVKLSKKKPKVVSSTSDESNTEAINETPCFVNTRRKNKKDPAPRNSFDEQVVEEFFSQHFTENKAGEIIISPTLAKKINETSSDTSDNFGENFNLINGDIEEDIVPYDFNNIEVLECLNNMVDRVCDEFDKCTEYLNKDEGIAADLNDTIEEDLPLKDIINKIHNIESKKSDKKSKKKPKLKYKITPKKAKARASRRKNKLELESASKMSTIIEDQGLESAAENLDKEEVITKKPEDVQVEETKQDAPTDKIDTETPITRKKRKLYSPKDEGATSESPQPENPIISEPSKIKKTPKMTATATCYKEIEKERQRRVRMPRSRKSKVIDPPSPRTKKLNDMFDKVKESADGEKVKLANKTLEADQYNFTSDSEDDFKIKKTEISKRNSTTTIGSFESTRSKRGRTVKRINYTDNKSSDDSNKAKRKLTRKIRSKKRANAELNDLIDERMRKAKDVLNTSILVEKMEPTTTNPILNLDKEPEMEIIEEKPYFSEDNQKKKGKKPKVETSESKRSKKVLNKAVVEKVRNFDDDNRTESPLPGLLVEPATTIHDDTNELSTMADKFKKIYQEGPENYINETSTTHNLLSDVERLRNEDITEEYIEIEDPFQGKEFEIKPNKSVSRKKKMNTSLIRNIKKERVSEAREVQENIEVINILEETEDKSEKSIATIGITGHGELDEEPPSPKLINERLEPRNLEVEDLDTSMKDYFEKLTKDMNESNNRISNSSNEENICKTSVKTKSSGSVKTKSPVISIKRMSSEDISRWLPSRRNSDSDDSYSGKSTKKNNEEAVVIESQTKDDANEVVEVNTKRQSMRLIFRNSQPVKISDRAEVKSDSDSESYHNTPKRSSKLRAKSKVSEVTKKPKSIDEPVTKVKTKHTSLISPIKLFDELISNADKQSELTLSDDEEYMKDIITTLAEKKKTNVPKPLPNIKAKSISTVSSQSKISTSTKIEDSRKRRLEEEREDLVKKRKVEVNNNVERVSSGLTVSSVDEWFKRIEPDGSRAEMISSSMRHSLQGVLERLDTTLVEIHRNTSKKFVHLFVNAQKQLLALKERRQTMYKQLASDILSDVVKIMDQKFADLDERSQELDGTFMKQLKEQASELIREDCKQKRVMVRLLKEDVQAVVDHLERQAL